MKDFASSAFRTVTGLVVGAGFGYLSARAGLGAFATEGSEYSTAVGLGTAAITMAGSLTLAYQPLRTPVVRFLFAASMGASALITSMDHMDKALTAERVNDVSQDRSLGFQGDCGKAGLQKFGSGVRFFIPQNCKLDIN